MLDGIQGCINILTIVSRTQSGSQVGCVEFVARTNPVTGEAADPNVQSAPRDDNRILGVRTSVPFRSIKDETAWEDRRQRKLQLSSYPQSHTMFTY